MKDLYVVYAEVFESNGCERWYCGMYDRNIANDLALRLNDATSTSYCVCDAADAVAFGIKNLPDIFRVD